MKRLVLLGCEHLSPFGAMAQISQSSHFLISSDKGGYELSRYS